jgi:hypothetical protein
MPIKPATKIAAQPNIPAQAIVALCHLIVAPKARTLVFKGMQARNSAWKDGCIVLGR